MEALGLVSGVVTIVAVVVSVAQELRQYVSELGRYAKIYGPIGAFLPCISNLRVWKLANDVLQSEDEKVVDSFRQAQVGQANMTAVTGAIMAQVAISGLGLENLNQTHWIARTFFLASILSGCASVYYAMKQVRLLGMLICPNDVKEWLRAPPKKIACVYKNYPSLRAVLILDTPRWLVGMAAIFFVIGLSIYVAFLYINNVGPQAGPEDTRNMLISYYAFLPICMAIYSKAELFDAYAEPELTRAILEKYNAPKIIMSWFQMEMEHSDEVLGSVYRSDTNNTYPTAPLPVPSYNDAGNTTRPTPDPVQEESYRAQPSPSPATESPQARQLSLLDALDRVAAAHRDCAEADKLLARVFETQSTSTPT